MKKFIVLMISMLLMAPAAMNAQSVALTKSQKKEIKKKVKEFNKGGWKLFGSTRTLEGVLTAHFEKLNALGENGSEIVGVASVTDSKHKNLLKQNAIANVCNEYAAKSGRHVRGRSVSDIGLTDDEKSEFEHFYAAYESQVDKEIKGELKESFTVIKEVSSKQIDMQTYYIVDEDAATKARIRAFENAKKESEIAQKYASQLSEFIREGMKE